MAQPIIERPESLLVAVAESEQQQRRYKALIDEFRCPKCLNTNLSGSDAPIALDLRRSVYRLVRDGHTDQYIRDFLQQRYGDFVLYKPPFSGRTAFIWLIPIGLLLLGDLFVSPQLTHFLAKRCHF